MAKDLQEQKEQLADDFGQQFQAACTNILNLQQKGLLGEIHFIIVTLLRTRIMAKNYVLPIKVCNQSWWLDSGQQDVGTYDAGFFFSFYEQMRAKLEYERPKYVGKTIEQDVDTVLSSTLSYFLQSIAQIANYKIAEVTATETFQQIKRSPELQIHVGEYLGDYQLIFGPPKSFIKQDMLERKPHGGYFWVTNDRDFMPRIAIEPLTFEELKGQQPVIRHVKWPEAFESTILADYITTSTIRGRYHLISDRFKQLCAIYDKQQTWMPIIFINQRHYSYVYWFWQPKTINCLSEQTTYNFDRTVKKLAINTKNLANRNQFMVATPIQKVIVVRLDLAESMLRRGFIGFKLRQVALAKGEG